MAIDLSSISNMTVRGSDLFNELSQAGTNQVMSTDEMGRMQQQASQAAQGISRSGFAAQAMNQDTYKENQDIASVNAQATEMTLNYEQQQKQIQLQQAMLKYEKKKARTAWIGTALSVVAAVVGTLICPGIGTMLGMELGGLGGQALANKEAGPPPS